MGNEEKLVREMHEIRKGSGICKKHRSFAYAPSTATNNVMARALIVKKVIKMAMAGVLEHEDIPEEIERQLLAESIFDNEEQRRQLSKEMSNQITRYVSCEKRVPIQGTAIKDHKIIGVAPIIIRLGSTPVRVKVDCVFQNSLSNGDVELEFVRYKTGGKLFSQQAATRGNISAMEVYTLLLAAQRWVKPGTKGHIRATLISLSRADDVAGKPWQPDFWANGGRNVVTINEMYENAMIPTPTMWDRRFQDAVDQWENGIEPEACTKEDCLHCNLKDICQYEEPPLRTKIERSARSLRGVIWTKDQEDAISIEHGIYRINATAGSGKTATMVYHVATLLLKGADPKEILMITFTNAAADEMRERLALVLSDLGCDADVEDIRVMTFNGFEDEIISQEFLRFGYTAPPMVIDAVERGRIIEDILREHVIPELNYKQFKVNTMYVKGALFIASRIFEVVKKGNYSVSDVDEVMEHMGLDSRFVDAQCCEKVIALYDMYAARLEAENLMEFADQDNLVRQLLHEEPDYLDGFGIGHIIVDEFQDTDEMQVDVLRHLMDAPTFRELTVVGDDSQAIYGFRGCTPEYMIDFEQKLDHGKVNDINLVTNFRSSKEICEFANMIIQKNQRKVPKAMISARGALDKPVHVRGFAGKQDEHDYMVSIVEQKLAEGTKPEHICIIAGKKSELREIASRLTEKGIASVGLFPEPLKDNSRIQAAMSLVRMLNDGNTSDCLVYANALLGGGMMDAPKEVLKNAVDTVTQQMEALRALDDDDKKVKLFEMLERIDHNEDELYQQFLDRLKRKQRFDQIVTYCRDFEIYGEDEEKKRDASYPGVALITAHSSKGLEWPIVISSISSYDGVRIREAGMHSAEDEEKRRLLFVAATRARDELFVTSQYYIPRTDKPNTYLLESMEAVGMAWDDEQVAADLLAAKEKKNAKNRDASKKWDDWLLHDQLEHPEDYSERDVRKARRTVERSRTSEQDFPEISFV